MLVTVQEFRERVEKGMEALVIDLQAGTGRYGSEEAESWRQSLPKLAMLLSAPSLQCLHLYVERQGSIALEYQLPSSGGFADAVLLGAANNGQPSAVIVELKDWVTRADRPGLAEGLIERRGSQELHPSDQVRGYVEYCRHFSSAVQDFKASVHGCVLLTRDFVVAPLVEAPNDQLTANYPVFTLSREDVSGRIPAFLCGHLSAANEDFAKAFATAKYRQERGFVQQIARQIRDTSARPFELIDNQRRAFALCKAIAAEVIQDWQNGKSQRRVIAVIGPPGSGKSAVAARLWAELSLNEAVPDGDIVFVTTSMSQNTNWADLFEQVGREGARGVVRKATTYHPVSTARVGSLRKQLGRDFIRDVSHWRTNLNSLKDIGESFRNGAEDQAQLISIVDEAHALINTEKAGGVGQFGFQPTLGPQAYHIIRASTLTVLFLDPAQGFRHRENTGLDDIEVWSKDLDAGDCTIIDLSGVQFRCAGSVEYVAWLDGFLGGGSTERNQVLAGAWYMPDSPMHQEVSNVARNLKTAEDKGQYAAEAKVVALKPRTRRESFSFRVFDNPFALESALREKIALGNSARLLSTYSREWRTEGMTNPHRLPPSQQDFCEECSVDGEIKEWSRIWNFVPNGDDYTLFVQGKPHSGIGADPLCEVGCPYAIRGFDFDFVGVLWLEDFVWHNGQWKLDLSFVKESGLSGLVRSARNEVPPGPKSELLLQKVAQAYRILLTRALKGAYVWVKDDETRQHILSSLRAH